MVNFPAIALLGATLVSAAPRGWEDWGNSREKTSSVSLPPATSPALPSASDPLHWADWGNGDPERTTSTSSKLATSSKTSTASRETYTTPSNGHGWDDWSGNRPNWPNRPNRPGQVNNNSPSNSNSPPSNGNGNIPYVKPTTVRGNAATQTLSAAWANEPAMFSQGAPTATLAPALHWDHQPRNPNHLIPGENQKIYFAGGKSSEFPRASLPRNRMLTYQQRS